MTTFITEEARFHAWEARSEPEVGKPDGQTVFEDNGISKYLWHTAEADAWIHSDTSMEIRR